MLSLVLLNGCVLEEGGGRVGGLLWNVHEGLALLDG